MRRGRLAFLIPLLLAPRAVWPQGDPLGPEFRANTYTTGGQYFPAVASDPSGNFVVVWQSDSQDGPDGTSTGVFGQRFASSGIPLGPEFRVNTYTTDSQGLPSIAVDGSGNFVVVWRSQGQDYFTFGVFGQRFASSGAPLGLEFRVNTYTTGEQRFPSVAADSAGNFVVVWRSLGQDGASGGIFGQRYASSGMPVGPEFRVNTYTTASQFRPAVTSDASGNFVVAWCSTGQDGSSYGIFGQRYASSGEPLGPEFRVNTYTTNAQLYPTLASDTSGGFVVVWQSEQDGSARGVFGQRYASSGTPLGPEFRVNTVTAFDQVVPSVAADASGNFVVAWYSTGQDGSSYGVFGQRFGRIVPVELTLFSVE